MRSASSAKRSTRIERAPSSAAVASATPFSASMKVAAIASGIFVGIGEQRIRQRLEPRLFRDLRLRPPLRLVGQIDVFEPRLRIRRHDLRLEHIVELALLADRIEDRGAALLQLAQIAEPLLQRAELRIVEHARHLFAVARDEGHRRAAVQKLDGRLHLLRPHAKLFRNPLFDGFHRLPLRYSGAAREGGSNRAAIIRRQRARFKTRVCNMHGGVALRVRFRRNGRGKQAGQADSPGFANERLRFFGPPQP